MENKSKILGWSVCYVPNYEGRQFAGLKTETIERFNDQDDAIAYCDDLNYSGTLDELHIGYRVYPMHWIPQGTTLR